MFQSSEQEDYEKIIDALKVTLQFYADPHSYERGYTEIERTHDQAKGLLTEPLVIQDGGKKAREVLAK